ncbi:MAG: HEAT repeat domain-containing protein [Thermodesulfovibrio sp.]|nr:HEAT repeat domain-containing protein [Thermodesulfovibrio sp.]MCX7723648.1 HEAT repeat domain-containing protein [Thermodesulfovibrio sp.]MDW7972020.1 HEAT repeat domain-containing protein [Thermodesulfovibrio sp.]
MRKFINLLILGIILFPLSSCAFTVNELFKELDTPKWREKVSDPLFLEKFKNPDMLSVVIKLADERGYDWRYRIRAITLLGKIGTSEAMEALLSMFQDHFFHHGCPSLRSYIADALGNFKPNRRLLEILKEGLKDPEVLTREATAKSLGRLKMEESVKYLKDAFLSEKSLAVKIAIINALKSIGTEEALNFIKELASDIKNKELIDVFRDYS